jgi:hypothetical protein
MSPLPCRLDFILDLELVLSIDVGGTRKNIFANGLEKLENKILFQDRADNR